MSPAGACSRDNQCETGHLRYSHGPHSSRNWRHVYYKTRRKILQCFPAADSSGRIRLVSALGNKKSRIRRLYGRHEISSWRQRDSNPRPLRCERNALPAELCPLYPISIALNEKNASEIVNNYGFFPKIWEIRRALAGGDPSVKAQTYGQWPLPGRPRSSFRSGGSAPAGSPQASG